MATQTTDDPREAARQFLGDLDHAYTGDWHQALKDAAAQWEAEGQEKPEACWFCGSDDNPARYTVCGFCGHLAEDAPNRPVQAV